METTNSGENSKRKKISSASKWEDVVGYSRAVRVGNIVEVAGTTAVDDKGNIVGIGDFYAQTVFILTKISQYLELAGATMEDVVRTRMFVTDISHWEDVGKAHGEFFKDIKPVASMLEIKQLIDAELLVEIEVTALIDN